MGKILVTGGAGYIGSFIVRQLRDDGFTPVIVDDLNAGHKDAVQDFELHEINLVSQKDKLDSFFENEDIEGVIHMAAFIKMGESFREPAKYFENNLIGTINLLNLMVKHEIPYIVFSSSAGVYGNPESLPIKEDDKKDPVNPYGETKHMIERMFPWYEKAYGIKFSSIRYFNAAGAALDGKIGEDHPDESHLIPLAIDAAIKGEEFTIFGDDYDTADGTNIRDYVHVVDLAKAHTLALQGLMDGAKSDYYNAGGGKGYSNKEVMAEIVRVTGLDLNIKYGPRRPGDADELVASIEKIKSTLGWEPKLGLKEIIESAYKWHKKNPQGYKK